MARRHLSTRSQVVNNYIAQHQELERQPKKKLLEEEAGAEQHRCKLEAAEGARKHRELAEAVKLELFRQRNKERKKKIHEEKFRQEKEDKAKKENKRAEKEEQKEEVAGRNVALKSLLAQESENEETAQPEESPILPSPSWSFTVTSSKNLFASSLA